MFVRWSKSTTTLPETARPCWASAIGSGSSATAAMRLLTAGVDITPIALRLGHEQISTTNIYLHADMAHKERAVARITPPDTEPGRNQPTDTLLAFVEAL